MYREKLNLTRQVAVVTGGARNIGLACATAFGEAGARIVITDIDDSAGNAAVAQLRATGFEASFEHMDVCNSKEVNSVADKIQQQFGSIDILVANAGICFNTPGEEISDEEWARVVDINFNGVFYCDRAFGRHMLNNPAGGRIINIGSISGQIAPKPQPQCHYNATKAAVHMLTKSLAAEWAQRGVRVNAIAPTYVETDITKRGMANPEWFKTWMDMTPLGRMGQPSEIASVALFLASDLSSLITGAVVVADGGYTCW
ncbi:MAG TPA: SDR family oxidoreductase [Rhizobium sp.]